MSYDEFIQKMNILNEEEDNIYISEDFQCDMTGGYPTSLCVNWDKGKAWLSLNDSICTDEDLSDYQQLCANYGIRDCNSIEDFNNILHSLGSDAEQTAYLPDEDDCSLTM